MPWKERGSECGVEGGDDEGGRKKGLLRWKDEKGGRILSAGVGD